MAKTEKRGLEETGPLDEALLKAISHPLRHRLLMLLTDRVASPNELARELDLPLGRVSYHIRLLNEIGAIELVRTEPRRGALEHFYRGVARAWFSEDDLARLPPAARRGIVGQNLRRIYEDINSAVAAGGFDHPATHVSATLLELDEQGIAAVSALLRESLSRVQEISAEAAARRAGAPALATELAMLHFERPAATPA